MTSPTRASEAATAVACFRQIKGLGGGIGVLSGKTAALGMTAMLIYTFRKLRFSPFRTVFCLHTRGVQTRSGCDGWLISLPNQEIARVGDKAIRRHDPVTPCYHEAYPPEPRVVSPGILEPLCPHGAVPPGGVRKQHSIPASTTEHDKVIVAVQIQRHYDRGALDQVL